MLVLALLGAGGWLFVPLPPPLWYRTRDPGETAFMTQRHAAAEAALAAAGASAGGRERTGCGGRRAELRECRRYARVPLARIAPVLVEAVLTGEDARFRQHRGIDWVELRRAIGYRRERFAWDDPDDRAALLRALPGAWTRRRELRGASTITQQLAKNLYLSPARSPLRKLREAALATHLEWVLPKDRILELYLNVAEFGPGIWGVEAAAQAYFGTSAATLTRSQATALAATLPFPRSSNPAYKPARMLRRQNLLLRRLRGEAVEVPREADEADGGPADATRRPPPVDALRVPTDTTPPVLPDSAARVSELEL